MGRIVVSVGVFNPAPEKSVRVDALVDTGASHLTLPTVWKNRFGKSAAAAHFAASTPPEFLVNTTDPHNYNTRSTGAAPPVKDGKLFAPDAPGLGVAPDYESLGKPVAEYVS